MVGKCFWLIVLWFQSIVAIDSKNILIGIELNNHNLQLSLLKQNLQWMNDQNIPNNFDNLFVCIYTSNKLKPLYNPELFRLLNDLNVSYLFSNSLLPFFCSIEHPNLLNYDGIFQFSANTSPPPSSSITINELSTTTIGPNLDYFYFDSTDLPSIVNEIKQYRELNRDILATKLQQFIHSSLRSSHSSQSSHSQAVKQTQTSSIPIRANPDKYHSSGPCNLWWPLNHTEIYLYAPSSSSLSYSHKDSIIFTCSNMLTDKSFSSHSNPLDEQFVVVFEELRDVHSRLTSTDRIGDFSSNVGQVEFLGKSFISKPLELQIQFEIKPTEKQKRFRLFLCPMNAKEISHLRKKPLTRIQTKMQSKSCFTSFDLTLNIIRSDYVYPHQKTCSEPAPSLSSSSSLMTNKPTIKLTPMIGIIHSRDIFVHVLTSLGYTSGTMVEIGVNRGHYASKMLSQWHGNTYILVDPWTPMPTSEYVDIANLETEEEHERIFQEALTNIQQYSNRTIILRNTSIEASQMIVNDSIDIIYIDGLHHYQGVWDDITSWWLKLKSGGIMAGHDYMQTVDSYGTIFTVKSAVDEFARKMNQIVYHTQDNYPTWFLFKV